MKILMLSAPFPYPPTRGGTEVRTFNLMDYLCQRHEITLVAQRQRHVTDEEVHELERYVERLEVFPPGESNAGGGVLGKVQRFAEFMRDGRPPYVRSYEQPHMQALVDREIATGNYDAITCEHSINEIFVRPAWRDRLNTVIDVHSSIYASCRQQLEMGRAIDPLRERLNLPLLERYERQHCQKFSTIVATTPEDGVQMREFSKDSRVHIIPNGVDLSLFPYRDPDSIAEDNHRLIFVGAMNTIANIDSATFLAKDVFPLVRDRYPDATLSFVGTSPTPEVKALERVPGVEVTGRVPSMVDYLHRSAACVLSMRIGYGIKNKTLEALAAGVPVVASDSGLEGLEVDGEKNALAALRANSVPEYVEQISRIFEEADLRRSLAVNGRALIERSFTWERAGEAYEAALAGTAPSA
ncbi:MAG: glycosyltransferase family 4 protein [Geitlerinemataceae cyanobacterium]|mgnify:CR=1 FL=1